MREAFIEKKFAAATLAVIEQANVVLEEYSAQGYTITLRQLYYQFVARGWLENKQTEYSRLGGIVSNARLAGLIDWAHMEDRVRKVETINVWDTPASIVEAVARQYKEDLWIGQMYRPEVWVEKDALVGVIERPCRELRVPYFACRGYVSQSAQYEAAQRIRKYIADGQVPMIFHLGDHDPSGIDMTRENRDKIALLVGEDVQVERLALNFDQVQQYKPPPNPAKETDSRSPAYIAKFGGKSWELDALPPDVLATLVRNAIKPLIDDDVRKKAARKERENRTALQDVSDHWDTVTGLFKPKKG